MRQGSVLLLLLAAACSSVKGPSAAPMPLTPAERARVEAKVSAARGPGIGDWEGAWNQAVDAGLGRETLEGIALDALEDDASVAASMLTALRDEYGGLTEPGRRRVDGLTEQAAAKGDYARALEVELVAADDAPTFAGAWRVYEEAPADESATLLEKIRKAREKAPGR
jgi:hypothetical protein